MAKRQLADPETPEAEEECAHFWRIESPNGPSSVGVCTKCGASEEFANSMPGTGWDRGTPEAKRAAAQRAKAKSS